MKRRFVMSCLPVLSLCFATTAGAHHSFAMFDRSKTETIAGTVKDFELINPHGWLRVVVANANGVQSEWPVELGGAGQLSGFMETRMRFHPERQGHRATASPPGRLLRRPAGVADAAGNGKASATPRLAYEGSSLRCCCSRGCCRPRPPRKSGRHILILTPGSPSSCRRHPRWKRARSRRWPACRCP